MVEIREVTNQAEKTAVSRELMHRLRKWFNPTEDIEQKALLHQGYTLFAAYDEGQVVGFLVLKSHNNCTAEIFNMGVLEDYHRRGIGQTLLQTAIAHCRLQGHTYLTVKTLADSVAYEPYQRTRSFYVKHGFCPLEVFKTHWGEDNPCLFMAKYLGAN